MNSKVKPYTELDEWVPLRKVVDYATIDDYDDAQVHRQRFNNWAIRGYRKLNLNLLRKVKEVLIPISRHTGTGPLPQDFRKVISAGYYDLCGVYKPIMQVGMLEVMKEERACKCGNDKCTCTQDSLCNAVSYERVEEIVHIGNQDYTNVIIRRFDRASGTYKEQREEWVLNEAANAVQQRITTSDLCQLETRPCGCIADSEKNIERLRRCGCCGIHDWYNRSVDYCFDDYFSIDEKERQIHVGLNVRHVRLKYYAHLPCINGEVLFPAVAIECLAAFILWKRDQRRKISITERQFSYQVYKQERKELRKALFPIKASVIENAMNLIPY